MVNNNYIVNLLVVDEDEMAVGVGGRILVVVETDEVLGIIVVVLVVGLKYLYGVVGTVGLTERVMGIMIGGRFDELYVVVATVVVVVDLVVGTASKIKKE